MQLQLSAGNNRYHCCDLEFLFNFSAVTPGKFDSSKLEPVDL